MLVLVVCLAQPSEQTALLKCMHSGIENPDATIGCYACHPTDYDRYEFDSFCGQANPVVD